MDVALVMPDHLHLIFNLLHDARGNDFSLAQVMKGIKGVSAHGINQLFHRSGQVWLDESFDHVMRESEDWPSTFEYVCDNPVRNGLVTRADDYPWLWRSWIEGGKRLPYGR